jgi:hypothetical protein
VPFAGGEDGPFTVSTAGGPAASASGVAGGPGLIAEGGPAFADGSGASAGLNGAPFAGASGVSVGGQGGQFAVATAGGPPVGYAYAYAPPGRIASFFNRLGRRMPEWLAPAGIGVCVAGGVSYTLLADPTSADAAAQPTCVMKLLTGFDCPGCGGTRAAWFLLHGDIAAGARHHLPLVFATPFLIYMYVAWALNVVMKREVLPMLRLSNTVLAGFLGAWIVFSIVRNLPWAPFTWLYV